MNGKLFENLPKLLVVSLRNNTCVNRNYNGVSDMTRLRTNIALTCGFKEPVGRIPATETTANPLKRQTPVICEQTDPKTCAFRRSTIVKRNAEIIGKDNEQVIDQLNFSFNLDIYFLPIYIYKKFPNLDTLWAVSNSLKLVRKKNFENLSKLRFLDLKNNLISSVRSNTFEGLKNLQYIALSKTTLC